MPVLIGLNALKTKSCMNGSIVSSVMMQAVKTMWWKIARVARFRGWNDESMVS
jgi:hypothetical protein